MEVMEGEAVDLGEGEAVSEDAVEEVMGGIDPLHFCLMLRLSAAHGWLLTGGSMKLNWWNHYVRTNEIPKKTV